MIGPDGRSERYLDFKKSLQKSWQWGPAFSDGRVVVTSMESTDVTHGTTLGTQPAITATSHRHLTQRAKHLITNQCYGSYTRRTVFSGYFGRINSAARNRVVFDGLVRRSLT